MRLVFTAPHTVFHHQCVKMVNILINHFEQQKQGLNPHATPYVHRNEEKKVDKDENNQQQHAQVEQQKQINKPMDGCDFGWKVPSKTFTKRNVQSNTTTKCVSNDNKYLILEDVEADQESVFDNPHPILSEVDEESNMKSGIDEIERCKSFDVEDLSTQDIEKRYIINTMKRI